MKINAIGSKIIKLDTIENVLLKWRKENSVIVFTNGCFDILHYGHIHYLADAKDLGDKLIVGMNSANSVRRLKGETRPINDELTRLYMLASLEIVDAVISFEEDTPYDLIKLIKPDILVKGGDWRTEQIVGSDIVLSNGGIVKSLPFIGGYSTTNIEKKIRGW
jgi:rfaE bifunctional protein nucleotidyltransferase chain/domain